MAEVNKNITVGEALDLRGKASASMRKAIEAAGVKLSDSWTSLANKKFLIKLNDVGSEAHFTELLATQERLIGSYTEEGKVAPFVNVFGQGGQARKIKVNGEFLAKARQARLTKAFKGVPEAKQSLKALTEGVASIKDPGVRSAVAFNALVPLRPGEVAGIRLDDIDFETGAFKETYRRVNKIRNELDLPEVALEILRDAAETAKAEGREYLFLKGDVKDPKKATSAFVNRMTSAVKAPDGIAARFKPFAKQMGREVAGASDIRKIIPSIIANELGYTSEASAIMGHSSFDETIDGMKAITRKHYTSRIITGEGTTAKQALRALQNMYGEVLGLSTLNELPASMGVEAKGLTVENAPKLAVIPKGAEIVGTQVQGTLTDADLDIIEDVRAARSQELKLAAAVSEAERLKLEAQMGDLDENAIRAKVRRQEETKRIRADEQAKITAGSSELTPEVDVEAREGLKAKGFDAKSMAASINEFLGKATKKVVNTLVPVGVGTSVILAAQEADAQGDSSLVATAKGVAAGASEVLAPPGMAYSDKEFREESRATTPRGTGLGPRTDVAPQTSAMGYTKPEFASYPMEESGFVQKNNRDQEAAPAQQAGFINR